MAPFTRKKSKKDRAAKAAKKTAKNAAKGVAIVEVAKHAPKKRISLIAGGLIAAIVATKILRGRHGDPAAA
jgi:hypothetical protein